MHALAYAVATVIVTEARSRRPVDCRGAVSLLVDAVAVHEERVAMEVGVVDVGFIAFCHHMPSHPDTAPFYSHIAISKAVRWEGAIASVQD